MKEMRQQEGHYHARPRYAQTEPEDFVNLFEDFRKAKILRAKSLNVHLPFEIQHPSIYPDLEKGRNFIIFGEISKRVFDISLYWENSPEVNYGTWDLKYGQTVWGFVPNDIELTLDTGHLMLGAKDKEEAQERVDHILFDFGARIKHLHIHENDLIHDDHIQVGTGAEFTGGKVITKTIFMTLTQAGRTYIFEKGIPDKKALKP